MSKKRLGDVLIEKGIITKDQVYIALTEQKKSNDALGKILVNLGFVTEAIIRDALGEMFGSESIDLGKAVPDQAALHLIDKHFAKQYNIVPVSYENKKLIIAMEDIYNLLVLDRLRAIVSNDIEIIPVLAGSSEILAALDQFYGYELSIDGILKEIETGESNYDNFAAEEAYSHPLVRLVDAILSDAVKRGASDIHFEPEEGFLRLRYRIDGVLRQIRSLHKEYWSAIVVRLKVISGMNIAEMRAPQDGRITLQVSGHKIDFRVSAQPTTYGENIVLRVLDRAKSIVLLDDLGLYNDTFTTLKLTMARPEGIILVTGPTGSGKTTTLYSMLNYRKSEQVNIMTLEDPVEYPMELIRQTSINEVSRMDFATGIRSIMRQDPDIILVGEIRDEDTAEMAFRAAMTGHQVFSTLHTNSAIGTIPRLLDIGVLPDIMSGNIISILAQRLVRKLCRHCKKEKIADEIEQIILDQQSENLRIYEATGCPHCDFTGYKGRLAILEILQIDDELDTLIAQKAPMGTFKEYLKSIHFRTLSDDGIRRIIDGSTSLEEISRVIDMTVRLRSTR